VRVFVLKGKNGGRGVQGLVLVTWTRVDIILLELAQEPIYGENVSLDSEPEFKQ
jgi:hypothetical protein